MLGWEQEYLMHMVHMARWREVQKDRLATQAQASEGRHLGLFRLVRAWLTRRLARRAAAPPVGQASRARQATAGSEAGRSLIL
jgi:hypothetical protein